MATTSNDDCCGRNSTYQADNSATNTNTLTTSTTTTKTMNNDREANRRLAKRRSLGRDIVRIHQLTDLTDKPIRMAKDDICRSRVRATGSNCICCCYNSSIALVTTNDSYVIDHIPLDDIQSAQANSSLQYLALSNRHQIAIIDLVENHFSLSSKNSSLSSCSSASSQQSSCTSTSTSTSSSSTTTTRSKYTLSSAPASSLTILSGTNKPRNGAKVVNVAGKGLKMDDVRYWRWLDESVLALLTHEALFVCPIDQTQFNHPALTALSRSPQLLSIEKVCDIHPNLTGKFCQITDIQRDTSTNLYAISGLCRSSDLYQANYSLSVTQQQASSQSTSTTTASNSNYYRLPSFNSSTLKHSFSSVPSRLSQLVNNERSFDSIKSDSLSMAADIPLSRSIDQSQPPPPPAPSSSLNVPLKEGDDDGCQVCGLVQIYCKLRDRSQLIQVHAVTFAACPIPSVQLTSNDVQKDTGVACNESKLSEQLTAITTTTTLVAANRIDDKLRVHFIGMATSEDLTSNGQSASPLTKFHSFDNKFDYPVSIVCSTIDGNAKLHVAMIATKYGQLYVCSVLYGTILFDVRASYDVISSTVVDSTTTGLMAVCRNGQVLLVRLDGQRLGQLLDESRSLRPMPSFNHLNPSTDYFTDSNKEFKQNSHDSSSDAQQDIGSNILISTRL